MPFCNFLKSIKTICQRAQRATCWSSKNCQFLLLNAEPMRPNRCCCLQLLQQLTTDAKYGECAAAATVATTRACNIMQSAFCGLFLYIFCNQMRFQCYNLTILLAKLYNFLVYWIMHQVVAHKCLIEAPLLPAANWPIILWICATDVNLLLCFSCALFVFFLICKHKVQEDFA